MKPGQVCRDLDLIMWALAKLLPSPTFLQHVLFPSNLPINAIFS